MVGARRGSDPVFGTDQDSGVAHVTARQGNANFCVVQDWEANDSNARVVRVLCYDAAGAAAARFDLAFSRPPAGNEVRGFLWADAPDQAAYVPSLLYPRVPAYHRSDGARGRRGRRQLQRGERYEHRVEDGNRSLRRTPVGLSFYPEGNVQVTAVGEGASHCTIESIANANPNLEVTVLCFDGATPANAEFALTFTR
jgi:hypothetical protein